MLVSCSTLGSVSPGSILDELLGIIDSEGECMKKTNAKEAKLLQCKVVTSLELEAVLSKVLTKNLSSFDKTSKEVLRNNQKDWISYTESKCQLKSLIDSSQKYSFEYNERSCLNIEVERRISELVKLF